MRIRRGLRNPLMRPSLLDYEETLLRLMSMAPLALYFCRKSSPRWQVFRSPKGCGWSIPRPTRAEPLVVELPSVHRNLTRLHKITESSEKIYCLWRWLALAILRHSRTILFRETRDENLASPWPLSVMSISTNVRFSLAANRHIVTELRFKY